MQDEFLPLKKAFLLEIYKSTVFRLSLDLAGSDSGTPCSCLCNSRSLIKASVVSTAVYLKEEKLLAVIGIFVDRRRWGRSLQMF